MAQEPNRPRSGDPRSRRRRYAWTAFGLLAVAGIVFGLSGWPGSRSPGDSGSEPRISLFVNQTGERRELPMEEYVAGVVAGEMWEGWPQNAYAAQAILARTFTMQMLERGGTRDLHGTDMSTDPTEAQAYNPSKITATIHKAVQATRGQILTYQGRPIRAWFHAYSGGQTASAKEGLAYPGAEPPYLRPTKLPDNTVVPAQFKKWRAEFTTDEIRQALSKKGVNIGTIQSLQVVARGPSGRITEIEVRGDGASRRISGNDFRVALGADRMKSTLARTFTFANGRLVVEGTGSGHGVGLSQWDALMLARQGRSPQDILMTFFKDVRIEKRW